MSLWEKFLPVGSTNPQEPMFLSERGRALHYFYENVRLEIQVSKLEEKVEGLEAEIEFLSDAAVKALGEVLRLRANKPLTPEEKGERLREAMR